jgi:energy-coupling factor transport system permease protein
LAFFLYLRTTAINELILALRWFGLPFKAALVTTLAFRYVPYMANVYTSVVDAHRLRSDPGEKELRWWELRKRVIKLLPVLISVLIYAIKGIPMLSMALESRGMGRKNPRADYMQLKRGVPLLVDFLTMLLVLCILLTPLIVLIHQ